MIFNPWQNPHEDNDIVTATERYAENAETQDPLAAALNVINTQSATIQKLLTMFSTPNTGEY